ncbi:MULTISPECIES: hypothetical protein [unclassified Bradyrhizobium]|uniref:hypothetical protein n=1 Tax=unclassified Bradyrhizobium TaxID=2631580 RepID=UPI0029164035|nr:MULTISPECIES: hypothetical protein [unclassified Bradyrhizobium]
MSIIEKIVGLVPTVREKAKAVLDFLASKEGKIGLVAIAALVALGSAHAIGVASQRGTIESLRRDLGVIKLQLAAEQARPRAVPVCPETAPADVSAPEPVKPAQVTKPKVRTHAPAKHPARSGARLTPAESGWLSDIR